VKTKKKEQKTMRHIITQVVQQQAQNPMDDLNLSFFVVVNPKSIFFSIFST
jgi:hypothetical protein